MSRLHIEYVVMAWKALAVWAGILVLAVFNGLLREAVLIPRLGSKGGPVLSGGLLSALIVIVAYLSSLLC